MTAPVTGPMETDKAVLKEIVIQEGFPEEVAFDKRLR